MNDNIAYWHAFYDVVRRLETPLVSALGRSLDPQEALTLRSLVGQVYASGPRYNVESWQEVAAKSRTDLMKFDGIGERSVDKIVKFMDAMGIEHHIASVKRCPCCGHRMRQG